MNGADLSPLFNGEPAAPEAQLPDVGVQHLRERGRRPLAADRRQPPRGAAPVRPEARPLRAPQHRPQPPEAGAPDVEHGAPRRRRPPARTFSRSGCPRPSARARGWSRRSRYQSIRERSVSRNSRIRLVTWSSSSRGAIRRIPSSIAKRAAGSGRPCCVAAPQLPFAVLLEPDLERAVVESRAGRRVGGHRGRQHDRPLLAAHAHDHLQADLLQAQVAALGEGHVHAQRRACRCS